MNSKLPSLSIFVPAFNEAGNIEACLKSANEIANQISDKYEILLVDDGSADQTIAIAKNLQAQNSNIKIVQHESNQGYGTALQTGIKNCQYEYIFFTDADLQFDLSELHSFLPYVPDFDVVIGYRYNRQDPFIRILNAKAWNLLIKLFFQLKIKDINCAFKLFKKEVIQKIDIHSKGAMVSAEILIKLRQHNVSIMELPVKHMPRKWGSATGAKISVILLAIKELIRIKQEKKK